MIIQEDKSVDMFYPPPPPYTQISATWNASPVQYTCNESNEQALRCPRAATHLGTPPHRIKADLASIPSHLLLQIVYTTFPQTAGPYEGQGKPERQRENLFWLETSLRLVNRAFYIVSMHILRTTYLPAYDSLIRHPYTSDPFPTTATPLAINSTVHRELKALDQFIALLAHEDVLLDSSSLYLTREEAYKDLFEMIQPRCRLEDLIRDEGVRKGIITLDGEISPKPTSVNHENSISSSLPPRNSTPSPSSSTPSPTRTTFSAIKAKVSKTLHRNSQNVSPSPYPYKHPNSDPPLLPTIPFLNITVSFAPRKVTLQYTPHSNSPTVANSAFNGSAYGSLSLSAVSHGKYKTRTLVEVVRDRDEPLEDTARKIVRQLPEALYETLL